MGSWKRESGGAIGKMTTDRNVFTVATAQPWRDVWRGGLRVKEALALSEHDLDPQRGSVLVRCGKGGRRREIGMDG